MSSRRLVQRLVREQMAVFGEFPKFEPGHYTFLLDYVRWGAGDGMEHRNSTSISNPGLSLRTASGPAQRARHDLARVLPRVERRAHPAGRPRAVRLHARERHVLPLAGRRLHAVLRPAAADARRARPGRADRRGHGGHQRIGPPGAIGRADERARPRSPTPASPTIRSIAAGRSSRTTRTAPRSRSASISRCATDGRQADARRLHADALAAARQVRRCPAGLRRPAVLAERSARRARGAHRQHSVFADEFFDKYIEGRDVVDYAALLAHAGYVVRPANPDGRLDRPGQRAGRRRRHHDREPRRCSARPPTTPASTPATWSRRSAANRRPPPAWNALRQRKPGESVPITIRRRDGKIVEPARSRSSPIRRSGSIRSRRPAASCTAAQRAFREAWLGTRIR